MSYDFQILDNRAKKTIDHTINEVNSLRTGIASIQMLDTIYIDAYGSMMKLNEIAGLSTPDSQTIIISPWDMSLLSAIEKPTQQANLNLNPIIDGKIIRINIPPLTEETRKQLVKILHQKIEDGRIMIRGLRLDIKKEIEKQAGTSGISEDDIKKDLITLENKIKAIIEQLDEILDKKTAILMKV